jgi:formimidoylglutamate deiminase
LVNRTLIAPQALLPDGWADDVRIEIDATGTIEQITPHSATRDGVHLAGPVVPGMPDIHSHAFQRAFAGRAERGADARGNLWTWRSAMYGLAGRISPDDLEAIAAQLYVDLLRGGYTAVAEFHYLHHQPDGTPYANRAEMSERLIAGANAAGIGLTLLPVFYRWSDFCSAPPLAEQRRFVSDLDGYAALLDALAPPLRGPQHRLGIAPHSLRAVNPDDLRDVLALRAERDPRMPVHLHIAEVAAEVERARAVLGARPVEWLLANAPVDANWCAVHATHLVADESRALAHSEAVVGLCPTTEANLGDGLFAWEPFAAAGGRAGIGSDSNAGLDPAEEVRWLSYGQRLRDRRRDVTPSPNELYVACARDGARACGRPLGELAAGKRADLVVLDPTHPALAGGDRETLLDRWIVAGGAACVRDVYVGGDHLIREGTHRNAPAIHTRYTATMNRLWP